MRRKTTPEPKSRNAQAQPPAAGMPPSDVPAGGVHANPLSQAARKLYLCSGKMTPLRYALLCLTAGFLFAIVARAAPVVNQHSQVDRRDASSRGFTAAGGSGMAQPMMALASAPRSIPAADMSFGSAEMADGASASFGGAPPAPAMRSKMAADSVGFAVNQMQQIQQQADPSALQGPVILKSGSVNVEVMDVAAVMDRIRREAEAVGGFIESSSTSTDEYLLNRWRQAGKAIENAWPTNGQLALRVPAAKFDASRSAIKVAATEAGGRVSNEHTNGVDVTEQYVDVVTRQSVDEKSLKQMEVLLGSADSVEAVLAIKREMDAITHRLESNKAQRKSMESRASMSSLTVSLSMPQPPQAPPPPPTPGWSIGRAFDDAWSSLKGTARGVAEVAIYTLVFAAPVAMIGVIGVVVGKMLLKHVVPAGFAAFVTTGAIAGTGNGGDYSAMR